LLIAAWLAFAPAAPAADWYWRPNTASYGKQSGASYADAWSREDQIDWRRMQAGDRLLVCGRHDTGYLDRRIEPGRGGITISGACPGDPGEIISVGARLLPAAWEGPDAEGVYRVRYAGSPGIAMDALGRLNRLDAMPTGGSPCRSFHHAGGVFYYRPCGPPQAVYPGGGPPVVSIRHDSVTLEYLQIRNGDHAVEVSGASGAVLRHLRIFEHTGHGIVLSGRTSAGAIRFNEIHDVAGGIITLAGGAGSAGGDFRHDGWLVEGNVIHDVYGSVDAHAIGWAAGSDNVFRRNFIYRAAGSGITIYAWKHQETARNLIEDNVVLDVIRRSIEANQRGIELSGDNCWAVAQQRRGDIIRNNLVENVAEGIYVKFAPLPGAEPAVRIEGNRIRARETGIRWASAMGGPAPEPAMSGNEVSAPRRLRPVATSAGFCR